MTTPDFFLVGAPKCGTTSLARWLADHPQVFMCEPKEPFFFCRDIEAYRPAQTWQEYCALFADASEQHLAVGEASTSYIRSRVAIPDILQKLPDAKFVVCLRNPVEMIASVHAQMVRGVRDDVLDLGAALALEPDRRKGLKLPPGTNEPMDLIYTDTCALGTQLSRIYDLVDRARVHTVFMDDLRASPQQVWRDLQTFLAVPDDEREDFSTENARAVPKSMVAKKTLLTLQRLKNKILPGRSLGIGAGMSKALERAPRDGEMAMSDDLHSQLVAVFEPEIDTLEALTGRDLSIWRSARQ